MKIHGTIYIAIGLFIGAWAKYFGNGNLTFFFYIGLLFIMIGAVKLVLAYFSQRKPDSKHPTHYHAHQNTHSHPYHQQQGRALRHPAHLQQPPHPLRNATYYPSHNPHHQAHGLHYPLHQVRQ